MAEFLVGDVVVKMALVALIVVSCAVAWTACAASAATLGGSMWRQ